MITTQSKAPEVIAIKMEILIMKIWIPKRRFVDPQGRPYKLCNSVRRRILLKTAD